MHKKEVDGHKFYIYTRGEFFATKKNADEIDQAEHCVNCGLRNSRYEENPEKCKPIRKIKEEIKMKGNYDYDPDCNEGYDDTKLDKMKKILQKLVEEVARPGSHDKAELFEEAMSLD